MRSLVPAAALALAACGGGNQTANNDSPDIMNGAMTSNPDQRHTAQASGTADAEGIECGAVQPGSGNDVVGVTVGMSADDAYRLIACSNRALRVSFSDRGGFGPQVLPDGRRMRKSITAVAGGERIQALLVGLPGQERVVAITRELPFASGEAPLVTALVAQLQGKYGALRHDPNQYGQWSGNAIRGADGQPLPEGSLSGAGCSLSAGLGGSLRGDCGLSVAVDIQISRENPNLADRLKVSLIDGAFGVRQIQTVNAVIEADARARQNRDTENARGNTPNL